MHDLYYIKEPLLYQMGFFLDSNEPASKVAAFSSPNPRATLQARYGYATVQASLKLAQKYHEIPSRQNTEFFEIFHAETLGDRCPLRGLPRCPPASNRYRTSDGTCNNYDRPWRGSSMTPMQRFLQPMYEDGIQMPRLSVFGNSLPSPREISVKIHTDKDLPMASITLMFMQWGQFLDHDITSTAQSRAFNGSVPRCCLRDGTGFLPQEFTHPECLPISVSNDDWFLSRFGIRCMEFIRSAPSTRINCDLGWREQINQVTSYIDGSTIYGSDAQNAEHLRTFKKGQMQYGEFSDHAQRTNSREDEPCRNGAISTSCFAGGDGRYGEQPALTSLHTIWLRYHNDLASNLQGLNPHWSDEKVYQEARRIVGALIQHITYREFLPIVLGQDVIDLFELNLVRKGYYNQYNSNVNPTPANAFSSAAYRFGHSLVQNSFVRSTINHRSMSNNVSIHDEQLNAENIWTVGSVDRLILGLCNQPSQRRDEFIGEELTNHLFQSPNTPFGMDLAAINIQRGRDHGIPSYTSWREPCGLTPINNWISLRKVMSSESFRRFRSIYRGVDDIDLYTGGLAEKPVRGGIVGPTFACIIAQQFINLRKGDRFWYENGNFESSFTPAQLQQIRKFSLAHLICHTIHAIRSIQPFVFLSNDEYKNVRVSCDDTLINNFDLLPWAERAFNSLKLTELHRFDNFKRDDGDLFIDDKIGNLDAIHSLISVEKENDIDSFDGAVQGIKISSQVVEKPRTFKSTSNLMYENLDIDTTSQKYLLKDDMKPITETHKDVNKINHTNMDMISTFTNVTTFNKLSDNVDLLTSYDDSSNQTTTKRTTDTDKQRKLNNTSKFDLNKQNDPTTQIFDFINISNITKYLLSKDKLLYKDPSDNDNYKNSDDKLQTNYQQIKNKLTKSTVETSDFVDVSKVNEKIPNKVTLLYNKLQQYIGIEQIDSTSQTSDFYNSVKANKATQTKNKLGSFVDDSNSKTDKELPQYITNLQNDSTVQNFSIDNVPRINTISNKDMLLNVSTLNNDNCNKPDETRLPQHFEKIQNLTLQTSSTGDVYSKSSDNLPKYNLTEQKQTIQRITQNLKTDKIQYDQNNLRHIDDFLESLGQFYEDYDDSLEQTTYDKQNVFDVNTRQKTTRKPIRRVAPYTTKRTHITKTNEQTNYANSDIHNKQMHETKLNDNSYVDITSNYPWSSKLYETQNTQTKLTDKHDDDILRKTLLSKNSKTSIGNVYKIQTNNYDQENDVKPNYQVNINIQYVLPTTPKPKRPTVYGQKPLNQHVDSYENVNPLLIRTTKKPFYEHYGHTFNKSNYYDRPLNSQKTKPTYEYDTSYIRVPYDGKPQTQTTTYPIYATNPSNNFEKKPNKNHQYPIYVISKPVDFDENNPVYIINRPNPQQTTKGPHDFDDVPVFVSKPPSNHYDNVPNAYITQRPISIPIPIPIHKPNTVVDVDYDPVFEDTLTTKRPTTSLIHGTFNEQNIFPQKPNFPFFTSQYSTTFKPNTNQFYLTKRTTKRPHYHIQTKPTTKQPFPSYLYLEESSHNNDNRRPTNVDNKDPIDDVYAHLVNPSSSNKLNSGPNLYADFTTQNIKEPDLTSPNHNIHKVHKIDDKLNFKSLLPNRLKDFGSKDFVKISSVQANHLLSLKNKEHFIRSENLQLENREVDYNLSDLESLNDDSDIMKIDVVPSDITDGTWLVFNETEEKTKAPPVPDFNFNIECATELPKPMNTSNAILKLDT